MSGAGPRAAWLTPDQDAAGGGEYVARRLIVPRAYLAQVNGALAALTYAWAWEQYGTVTPGQAADDMNNMFLAYLESSDTLVGTVLAYAGPLPGGVLACDGSLYPRLAYPLLYARLDAMYHVDEDLFRVPDLRARFVVGQGLGYDLADTGGLSQVTLTIEQIPPHTHSYNEATVSDIDLEDVGIPQPAVAFALPSMTGQAGGGQAHENRPPFYALALGIVAR